MKALIPYFAVGRLWSEPGHCSICDKPGPNVEKVKFEVFYPVKPVAETYETYLCEECSPQYLIYNQAIKNCWDSINHLWPDAGRRWVENDNELEFGNVDWSVTFPLELITLIRDARHCFLFGMYSASIITISSAVELALNLDTIINASSWVNLTNLLKKAKDKGIDLRDLFEEGDDSEEINKLRFIVRRNKYAHGEFADFGFFHKYIYLDAKDVLLDAKAQLLCGQRFLRKWAASEGNPIKHNKRKARMSASSSLLNMDFYNPYQVDHL